MSRASAAVRFRDTGEIRYGIYDGTSDILQPRLFDTADAAWAAWRANEDFWPDTPEVETLYEVSIYETYGGGEWWEGLASRERVHGPLEWPDDSHSGPPPWHDEAFPAPSPSEESGEG